MKIISLALAAFVSLAHAASVSPPGSVSLIHPDPKRPVPRGSTLTFGFAEPSQQIYGLVQNVSMWYKQPDGATVPANSYGTDYTESSGRFRTGGYSPVECRTYPGTSSTNDISAGQAGIYTFFWNITYVMSSDTREANSTYCGPEPFTAQNWLVNSTVKVEDATVGSGASALVFTTSTGLPSSPTGKVTSGAADYRLNGWDNIFAAIGIVIGMIV